MAIGSTMVIRLRIMKPPDLLVALRRGETVLQPVGSVAGMATVRRPGTGVFGSA